MNKKMRLWVAGTVGVLMTGLMSVNAYALEEKDVIGTWYVNELSMGGDILFHPGVMGMEVTVDIKEGGQMETITSYSGEEPEADQSEYDYSLDINIARDLIAQTDEVSYYLGLGMSLWYTGTEEYIEGRNCPVFVIGTDHEEHFTKEKYYAAGDNVVYYYDPLGDAWLLLGAGGQTDFGIC